ncbi:hypothetical protein GUITHDRAFT_73602 [Guillardia theta CCMP2712]|uniref:Uncharacterized protein n=1 Tax=Guillardia theta (strain CCMP2712) TaxID=905079 RepID=L1J2T4_GUITC|nr:hypothetical protein GUITHDRAFT_73602 [Guillardia theta CCMP2712]EKX42828.1 hypothetical protein GUITHDRAFT_73602 [Guillardia theta CCMP2712]|eukprot:XP_005829808.1 hypothetical protein GUITHDRAFT_73602 [Guillardia theta CCMP2712]
MYKYASLSPATAKGKKYKILLYDKDKKKLKTIQFGASGYEDYTDHKNDERKERYLQRHRSSEDWNNPATPGAAARYVLWSAKSVSQGFQNYLNNFNLTKL